ncbi:MAG: hypothetical protein IT204_04885 [Fimbriimonadaceae bacterium]|nr:hypothetical protein [Fimbriimonadaceae bacterium]
MSPRQRQLATCLGAALVILTPGLGVLRYGDDLGFLLPDPAHRPWFHFTSPHPHHLWYRPLEALVLLTLQATCGAATWPLHLLLALLHGGLVWAVWELAGELGLGRRGQWLAAGWLLVSQALPIALCSNDTVSQVASGLAGCGALLLAHHGLRDGRRGRLAASLACYALALWSKESGTGALAGLLLLAILHHRQRRRGLLLWVAAAAVTTTYLAVRARVSQLVPGLGSTGYDLACGPNVLRNAVQLWGVVLSPVSTVKLLPAVAAREWPWLLLGGGGALLTAGGAVVGWRRQPRLGGLLLLLATTQMLPMLLLNHVSELHVYNALPLIALLLGGGWVACLAGRRGRLAGGLLALLWLGQLGASWQKQRLMTANGRAAAALLAEVVPVMRALPPDGRLVLVQPLAARSRYSVYVLHDFDLLVHGQTGVKVLAARPDVTLHIVEPAAALGLADRPACRVLTWRAGRLQPWSQEPRATGE